MPIYTHYFAWKNNAKRAELYGKACRIVARGSQNSRLVEFSNGQCEIVSGNSIRRLKIG